MASVTRCRRHKVSNRLGRYPRIASVVTAVTAPRRNTGMVIGCAHKGIEISGIRYCMACITVRASGDDVIGWFAPSLCPVVARRTSTRNSRRPVRVNDPGECRVIIGIGLGMALIAGQTRGDMVSRLTFGFHTVMACVTGSRDDTGMVVNST